MNKDLKIVIAGGGSTYTAGIVKELLDEDRLDIKEIWLYDIDKERQDKVAILVKQVIKENKPHVKLYASIKPEEALLDADFVMAQIRVGGLPMRVKDEQISLKHHVIGQETCGAGGMAYGMRTIYPMVELIDLTEKYAKESCWIVNYSNPAAIVAKATTKLRPHAKIINICDMPVEIEFRMSEILGCDLKDIEVDYFGLNHFGWYTAVRQNGVDVTDKLKKHVSKYGYLSKSDHDDLLLQDPDWVHTFETSAKIVRMFGDYLPNTYYQYYLLSDDMYKYMDINNTRGMQVINGREKRVFNAAEALSKGEDVDMNQFYVGVHGQFIVSVMTSLALDLRQRHLVMVENHGAIENLPDDAMVEIPAYITERGPEPIRVGAIPRFYKGLIEQQDACEGLLVEAAIEHSYEKALMAYTMNKTIPSANVAQEVLDDLIEANKDWWPELN